MVLRLKLEFLTNAPERMHQKRYIYLWDKVFLMTYKDDNKTIKH